MSDELKQDLIRTMQVKLTGKISTGDLMIVTNAMVLALDDYEITPKETALARLEDAPLNVLLRRAYRASLLVGGKSVRTAKEYERELMNFENYIGGKSYLEATQMDVWGYLLAAGERGVSEQTMNNMWHYLSAFWRFLVKEDKAKCNIVEKVPCPKVPDKKKTAFSRTEVENMKYALKTPREKAMIETLLKTGVRVAELVNLDWSDIDMVKKTVLVRSGKGNKDRTTYIDDVALQRLMDYKATRKDDNPAVFISNRGGRFTVSGVEKIIREIGKRAGVANVHPHRFRRTFATWMAERGMPIETIRVLMGHSSMSTTQIYVAMTDQRAFIEYMKYSA